MLSAQGLLKLAKIAKINIPDIIKVHVKRTQVLISLLNIAKKMGRKYVLNIATALIQNTYHVNKDNISSKFSNVKHFPQFNIPFIPLDGPATNESRAPALAILKTTDETISIDELYALIMLAYPLKVLFFLFFFIFIFICFYFYCFYFYYLLSFFYLFLFYFSSFLECI
jgi:hypothetical protein